MTEDMHEERLHAVEALGDSFVRLRPLYKNVLCINLASLAVSFHTIISSSHTNLLPAERFSCLG